MTSNTEPAERAESAGALPAGGADASEHEAIIPPRIWVGCLAAYNAGILHGEWIDVADAEQMRADTRAMLAASPERGAEEWGIFDYEGFEGASISEYASFDGVADLAAFISEYGALGGLVVAHFCEDVEAARAAFEDYAGEFKSLGDFAEDLTEQTGMEIPESLRFYIDYDAMGRDLELSGDVFTIETGFDEVHIFWAR